MLLDVRSVILAPALGWLTIQFGFTTQYPILLTIYHQLTGYLNNHQDSRIFFGSVTLTWNPVDLQGFEPDFWYYESFMMLPLGPFEKKPHVRNFFLVFDGKLRAPNIQQMPPQVMRPY